MCLVILSACGAVVMVAAVSVSLLTKSLYLYRATVFLNVSWFPMLIGTEKKDMKRRHELSSYILYREEKCHNGNIKS